MNSIITSAEEFPPRIQMNVEGPALTREQATERHRKFCSQLELLPFTPVDQNRSGDFTHDDTRRCHRSIHRDAPSGKSFATFHWVGLAGTPFEGCSGGQIDLEEVSLANPNHRRSVRVDHTLINGEGFEVVARKPPDEFTADGKWTAKFRPIEQVPDAPGPDPVYRPVPVELDPDLDFYSLAGSDDAHLFFEDYGRFKHGSREGRFHSTFGTGEHTEGAGGGAEKTHKWEHLKRGSVNVTEYSVRKKDQPPSIADVPTEYRGEVPPDFGQRRNGTCFTSYTLER